MLVTLSTSNVGVRFKFVQTVDAKTKRSILTPLGIMVSKQCERRYLRRRSNKAFVKLKDNPTKQPSTYSLLGAHFTKEDLSCLFCGKLNQAQAEERKKLAMKF